jgi:hypothetical protein
LKPKVAEHTAVAIDLNRNDQNRSTLWQSDNLTATLRENRPRRVTLVVNQSAQAPTRKSPAKGYATSYLTTDWCRKRLQVSDEVGVRTPKYRCTPCRRVNRGQSANLKRN